ncbi:LexA family transcriptional regulator [Chryseobacterium sp.]|uniref:XRE family transcriptional regulator n=1 Tax=Chryseobacterium sp. TaxID=1871047 RepID=UPI003341C0AA
MSLLAENLRFLRHELNASQRTVADHLVITRGRYSKYEDGASEPPIEILLRIARYYKVSMDLLVTVDLRKYKLEEILKLPDNRILLPIKIDNNSENKIEIVPYKASMGYLMGYADPEYIESLQTMSLPFLHNGKYRAFPVEGDSMPPYQDGTYIVGKYVESKNDIKPGKTYVLITRTGLTFKRIARVNSKSISVKADNPIYENYDISLADITEAWQYAGSFSDRELKTTGSSYTTGDAKDQLQELITELNELKNKIS